MKSNVDHGVNAKTITTKDLKKLSEPELIDRELKYKKGLL